MGERPLSVAFASEAIGQWTAGQQYLRNLFAAIGSLDGGLRPQLTLVTPNGASAGDDSASELGVAHIVAPPAKQRPGFWARQWIRAQQAAGVWREPEHPLSTRLRKLEIDALFCRREYGPSFCLPLISWIPDFQHVHLPEMFSEEELGARDERFSRMAQYADIVVLSSEAARSDFVRFAPGASPKARVLQFVAHVPASVYESDPKWVCDHYALPERFVYLPNQFWKHKNHEVVLRALAILKPTHPEIVVVCTGNTNDYRHPLYFPELLAEVSRLGLRDNLVLLGMVPHAHLYGLMRQSLAVLQPSLFEGWSTTVEETRSLGKSLILSDIPVHREQDPPEAVCFCPHSEEQLATCLLRTFGERDPGPDLAMEAAARRDLPVRMQQFGEGFLHIAEAAAGA